MTHEVGGQVVVSHGRCCGEIGTVTHANEHNFTLTLPCGAGLTCPQAGGYRAPTAAEVNLAAARVHLSNARRGVRS